MLKKRLTYVAVALSFVLVVGFMEWRTDYTEEKLQALEEELRNTQALLQEKENMLQMLGSCNVDSSLDPSNNSRPDSGSIVSPTVSGADDSLIHWNTTWKCYRDEDFSEICVYKNLCFNGEKIVFIDSSVTDSMELKLLGPEVDIVFDWRYWEPLPFPPPEVIYAPFMSTFTSKHDQRVPYRISSSRLQNELNSVEIMDGALWLTAFDMNPHNTWHHFIHNANLWHAQLLNETLSESEKLPPMDYVLMKRERVEGDWMRSTLRNMVQNHTQFLLEKWTKSSDSGSVKAGQDKNFGNVKRKNYQVDLNSQDLICARDAVVIGQKK